MMGSKERAFAPLCNLSLEALIPAEHFYRHLDAKLDPGFVRDLVTDCYAPLGRPSIDPVVFFKLQLVMFFEGLRSERELVRLKCLLRKRGWGRRPFPRGAAGWLHHHRAEPALT
jgi:hypothetical protein